MRHEVRGCGAVECECFFGEQMPGYVFEIVGRDETLEEGFGVYPLLGLRGSDGEG